MPPKQPPSDPKLWFAVRDGGAYRALGFAAVAAHRRQIEDNHGESLEALNAAGGLDWYELYVGMRGIALFPTHPIASDVARRFVLDAVAAFALDQA
jgi:hypothetical protein